MLFAQLGEGVLDKADVRAAFAVALPAEALTRFIEAELPRLEALN
jgi:hypothetical protein